MSYIQFYLQEGLKDQFKKDPRYTNPYYLGEQVYNSETTAPYVGKQFNPLNVAYDDGLFEFLKKVPSGSITRITAKVSDIWVSEMFPKDGEVFVHGETRCVVSVYHHRGDKNNHMRDESTLEISGKSASSIICLIRKMKNGTAHSEDQMMNRLKNENSGLRHELKEKDQKLGVAKAFLLGVEGRFKDYDAIKAERDEARRDRQQLLDWLKMSWWERLITNKPEVFAKFKLA